MASHQTADESRRRYIEAMGADLGAQYAEMWQQVAHLHSKWRDYTDLFGSKPSRIMLLNEVAGHFFRMIQDVLWDDIRLHIARLTDESGHGIRRNLTIKNFPSLVSDPILRANLTAVVDRATMTASFCREWRNKRAAHHDLLLATEDVSAIPLEGASRLQIKEALAAIVDVLKVLSGHYFQTDLVFDIGPNPNGPISMLYVLRDGIAVEKKRREDLRKGIWSRDDNEEI